jgi:hypothetical protein
MGDVTEKDLTDINRGGVGRINLTQAQTSDRFLSRK